MPREQAESQAPKAPPGVTRAAVKRLRRKGHTPRQIAGELGISTQAVHYHLRAIQREEAA